MPKGKGKIKFGPIPSETYDQNDEKMMKKLKYGPDLIKKFRGTWLINGAAGSGKSSFAYNFINDIAVTKTGKPYFDEGLIFLGTKDSMEAFEKVKGIKEVYVGGYDDLTQKLERYLNDLEDEQMKRKQEGKRFLRSVILLDDLAYAGKKLKVIEKLALNVRHYNILLIITSQTAKAWTNLIRQNAHFVVCYHMPPQEFEKIGEQWSAPLDKKEFHKIFYPHISEKYKYMCIDMYEEPAKRFRFAIDEPIILK